MLYVLTISIEKHQVTFRLINQEGHATPVTKRGIEAEFQSMTTQNDLAHIQRMITDGILSLLQKSGVKSAQVCAAGLVSTNIALLQQLELNLEWPIVISTTQEAMVYGHGCFETDGALVNFEEGCTVLIHKGLSKGVLGPILEGIASCAGSAVEWLQEEMGFIESTEDLERLAAEVETSLGVYFVPALNGLGMPYWDSEARGLFIGLTRGSKQAHLVRAVQEGFAFQVMNVLEALKYEAHHHKALKVSGEIWLNSFICQTLADVCQAPVKWLQEDSVELRGAAYLAGLNVGLWQSLTDVMSLEPQHQLFLPKNNLNSAYDKWVEAVKRAGSGYKIV